MVPLINSLDRVTPVTEPVNKLHETARIPHTRGGGDSLFTQRTDPLPFLPPLFAREAAADFEPTLDHRDGLSAGL